MNSGITDIAALAIAFVVALAITISLWAAYRGEDNRRLWIVAGAVAAVLLAIGLADLLRETPRQTHLATVFVGATLPVLGAVGLIRATRGVRPQLRWPAVFLTTFVLIFVGLLIGATLVPRYLG